MSQEISPLLGNTISWMYRNRTLLSQGYSGKDPTFSQAKVAFIQDMRQGGYANETDESLLQAFEDALNRV